MRNLWVLTLLALVLPAGAIELGQQDTFEDFTTNNWVMGRPQDFHPLTQPVRHDVDCGDLGIDDGCLRVFATGSGSSGSKLATFNIDQWTGDFISAGVFGIRIKARNFSTSPQDIRLRIMLQGAGLKFISLDSVAVPFNGIYNQGVIRLTPETLNANSRDQAETLLRQVERVWILHQPEPEIFGIPSVTARVYFDDLLALDDHISSSNFEE